MSYYSSLSITGSSAAASTRIRHSVPDLNKQLDNETGQNLHTFFGPSSCISGRPRVLHGSRSIHMNSKKIWLESEPISLEQSSKSLSDVPTSSTTAITSRLSAAGRFFGKKVAGMTGHSAASVVNADSFCDGCGMDPIVGNMWTCSTCSNLSLCENCYRSGVHGYENSIVLREVREDMAIASMVQLCKSKVPEEVFRLLLKQVCKGNVDKYNFLAKWIAGVVLGHNLKKLAVRGIEIPNLDTETRSTLVRHLTPALAQRSDIDVNMEWFDASGKKTTDGESTALTNLRVWIATDQDKSPFENDGNNRPSANLDVAARQDSLASPPMSPVDEQEESTPRNFAEDTPETNTPVAAAPTFTPGEEVVGTPLPPDYTTYSDIGSSVISSKSPAVDDVGSPLMSPKSPAVEDVGSPEMSPKSPALDDIGSPVMSPKSPALDDAGSPVMSPKFPAGDDVGSPGTPEPPVALLDSSATPPLPPTSVGRTQDVGSPMKLSSPSKTAAKSELDLLKDELC